MKDLKPPESRWDSATRRPRPRPYFIQCERAIGLIIGALGRLVHPGPDPIGILMTIVIGIGSALLVGWAVGGGILAFILAVIVAAVLVALFSRFVGSRRRTIAGPV
jgi:uncharacterized membrane protein YeaQ/YmgE (transglycosylase-associated protein family)